MNDVRIIINAICKNEEKNMYKWLECVKDADKIFLFVTGNEDDPTISEIDRFEKENPTSANKIKTLKSTTRTVTEVEQEGFSAYRNKILNYALIDAHVHTIHEHIKSIIITLDLDEFFVENGVNILRQHFTERLSLFNSYDSATIQGYTDGEGFQEVSQKVIIYDDRKNYEWVGFVHEELMIDGRPEKLWRKYEDLKQVINYEHKQDKSKKRNYYEMLKTAVAKEQEKNPRTLIYAAWEAYLHNEKDNALVYNLKCHDALFNKDQTYYGDEQIYKQTFINEAVIYIDKLREDINSVDIDIIFNLKQKFVGNELNNELHFYFDAPESYRKTRLESSIHIQLMYYFVMKLYYCYDSQYDPLILKKYNINDIGKSLYEEIILTFTDFYSTNSIYAGWLENREFFDQNYTQFDIDVANTLYYGYIINKHNTTYYIANRYLTMCVGVGTLALQKAIPDTNNYDMISNNLKIYKEALKMELHESENTHINESNELGMSDTVEEISTHIKNKVCVYAITKNESQFVDRWYESMKEADAIVVLDTGSTDDTVEKLRSHGVTVEVKVIEPWRFDVARNESLKLVPDDCNILISTDLDEILEPGWADIIRNNWIEGVHERGVYKYSWSHLANGESGRVFRYDKIHSRNWIWKYPVHELLWNTKTNTNLYDSEVTLDLFDSGVHLHHFPDYSKPRSSYLPLLELRAEENPDDYYGLIYLAHEYFYRSKYEKSIETLNKVLTKFIHECTSVEEASCYLFMGDSYAELKKYKESKDSYLKAISIDPSYREPYLNMAKVLETEGSFELAKAYILEGMKKSYRHYTWLERDASWSYEPYDLLSLACYYSGDKKNALFYAMIASDMDRSDSRLANNVKLIKESISLDEILQ